MIERARTAIEDKYIELRTEAEEGAIDERLAMEDKANERRLLLLEQQLLRGALTKESYEDEERKNEVIHQQALLDIAKEFGEDTLALEVSLLQAKAKIQDEEYKRLEDGRRADEEKALESARRIREAEIAEARRSAEERLALQRKLYDTLDAFIEAFEFESDTKREARISKEKDALKEEEDALFTSLKNREISLDEYNERYNEIQEEQLKLTQEAETQKVDIAKNFAAAGLAVQERATALVGEAQNALVELVNNRLSRELELRQRYLEEGKTLEDATAQATLEAQEEIASKRDEIFAGTVEAATGAFVTLVAEGENAVKALALSALDASLRIIPALIAEATLKTFAILGPFAPVGAGLVAAAGAAAIAALRSAIASFAGGVVALEGPGSETSDSIPAMLSRGESVVTAKGTKARGNRAMLEWVNKTGGSVLEYPALQLPLGVISFTEARERGGEILDKNLERSNEKIILAENERAIRAIARQTEEVTKRQDEEIEEVRWLRREVTALKNSATPEKRRRGPVKLKDIL